MAEILALLENIEHLLEPANFRQMSWTIYAMLSISGRITMLDLSPWACKGGSYRTIQCWYQTTFSREMLHWALFLKSLLRLSDEYLITDDESVTGKASKVNSKNVDLSPELLQIQQTLKNLLKTISAILSLKYVVLHGHWAII